MTGLPTPLNDGARRAGRAPLAALALLLALLAVAEASAQEPRLRVDGALTARRFEQQVKVEIGGARGERLVEETELGAGLMATWALLPFLDLGLYGRYDLGRRVAGRFEGFDDEGKTVVAGEVGGPYSELWLGPLVRGRWRGLFLELGYGALGLRWDEGRGDLANQSGETGGALSTSSTIAWLAAAGGNVELVERVHLVLRLEYRVRYYVERGGEALADEIAHGTQSLAPFVGVAWWAF